MTVDEYLAWAEGRPGRYELYGGEVFAMAPERAAHAEIKGAVYEVLKAATRAARCCCHVLPDGMTVRVDPYAAHEPDALVYCGQKVAGDAIEIPEPVIVVEVLSPSTRRVDASAKLGDYFRLPSVAHYLIVEPDPLNRLVIHHARAGDAILTRIVTGTVVRLDPPGIEVDANQFYA
ncbi:MAG: Uma2 family endonuclease [Hyphomicrobiaceae bacterium]|nr:Uma2 family endonuclease [Hyphomicrobiaceae bacterium]